MTTTLAERKCKACRRRREALRTHVAEAEESMLKKLASDRVL